MRKNIIYSIMLTASFFTLTSCGGDSSTPKNDPPSSVNLQAPTNNQLCIAPAIDFDWTDATDPNNDALSYEITFASDRDMKNVVKTEKTSISKAKVTLEKQTAYYWNVVAIDPSGAKGEVSETFAFFTKGDGVTNAIPFAAKLESPKKDDTSIVAGKVELQWKGADADSSNDELKYQVYFGETATPEMAADNVTAQKYEVTVIAGKTYYWKVNTIDPSGAKSVGQVWSFTVKSEK